MTDDDFIDGHNALLVRHHALEFLVQGLLSRQYPPETLDGFASKMREDIKEVLRENRAGAMMTRASCYGWNVPVIEAVAEILESAADESRPARIGADPHVGVAVDDPPPPTMLPSATDGGDPKVVSLFTRHARHSRPVAA